MEIGGEGSKEGRRGGAHRGWEGVAGGVEPPPETSERFLPAHEHTASLLKVQVLEGKYTVQMKVVACCGGVSQRK